MGKKEIVDEIAAIFKKNHLSYDQATSYSSLARKQAEIERPTRKRAKAETPTLIVTGRFLQEISKKGMKQRLMMRMLLFMAFRSDEFLDIRIDDVDLTPGREKIYVRKRKKGQSEYFAIPSLLVEPISFYIETVIGKQVYLFESGPCKRYTTRGLRQMMQRCRDQAGLPKTLHPHSFRHVTLTFLAGEGMNTFKLKNVSGHLDESSLIHYTHTNPEHVRSDLDRMLPKLDQILRTVA